MPLTMGRSRTDRGGPSQAGAGLGDPLRTALKWAAGVAGIAAGAYATCVGITWAGYGRRSPAKPFEEDPLLDGVLPEFDVSERHHVFVGAPADVTFATACGFDLMDSRLVRMIFKARELAL